MGCDPSGGGMPFFHPAYEYGKILVNGDVTSGLARAMIGNLVFGRGPGPRELVESLWVGAHKTRGATGISTARTMASGRVRCRFRKREKKGEEKRVRRPCGRANPVFNREL